MLKANKPGNQMVLISKGGIGNTIMCGATKAVVTTAFVTGGFIGGNYLEDKVVERTDNVMLGKVTKYGTIAASAIIANMMNNVVDNVFKYTKSTMEDIKGAVLIEISGMTDVVQPAATVAAV